MINQVNITELTTGLQGVYQIINSELNKLAAMIGGIVDCVAEPPSPSSDSVYLVFPNELNLLGHDDGTRKFIVGGDHTSVISEGHVVVPVDASGTQYKYTVSSVTLNAGTTEIIVQDDISSPTWGTTMYHARSAFNGYEWYFAHYLDSQWQFYQPAYGQIVHCRKIGGILTNEQRYFSDQTDKWESYA